MMAAVAAVSPLGGDRGAEKPKEINGVPCPRVLGANVETMLYTRVWGPGRGEGRTR
jgi:hypothetical protein